eukprot:6460464-Amphidinium_carterae.1
MDASTAPVSTPTPVRRRLPPRKGGSAPSTAPLWQQSLRPQVRQRKNKLPQVRSQLMPLVRRVLCVTTPRPMRLLWTMALLPATRLSGGYLLIILL